MNSTSPVTHQPQVRAGAYLADRSQPIPLLGVRATAEISGASSRVVLRQLFRNAEPKPVEAVYVFPLPEGAALCGLFGVDVAGPTVNNGTSFYAIETGQTGSEDGMEFRAIRVYYRLQVAPSPETATFADVETDHLFFQYVEAPAASSITAGCGAANFCPDSPVTRGQDSGVPGQDAWPASGALMGASRVGAARRPAPSRKARAAGGGDLGAAGVGAGVDAPIEREVPSPAAE